MSHIVTVKTEIRDVTAVRAACHRLGLAEPVLGTTKLFRGEVNGLAVQLPGWLFPVVADLADSQQSLQKTKKGRLNLRPAFLFILHGISPLGGRPTPETTLRVAD